MPNDFDVQLNFVQSFFPSFLLLSNPWRLLKWSFLIHHAHVRWFTPKMLLGNPLYCSTSSFTLPLHKVLKLSTHVCDRHDSGKAIKDPQGFDEVSSPFYDDTLLMVLHLMYVPLISIDGYCISLRCFFDNQFFHMVAGHQNSLSLVFWSWLDGFTSFLFGSLDSWLFGSTLALKLLHRREVFCYLRCGCSFTYEESTGWVE